MEVQSQNYRWKCKESRIKAMIVATRHTFDGKRIEWPAQAYVMADRPDLV